MKLRYSPTSPYVRKVMVVALETGLAERIERIPTAVAPTKPNEEVARENPLVKVPALTTDEGLVLYDSPVICEYLDTLHERREAVSRARARRAGSRCASRRWATASSTPPSSAATRCCGPKEYQWQDWIDAQMRKVRGALAALEIEVRRRRARRRRSTIGQITVGCALGYLDFRYRQRGMARAATAASPRWYRGIVEAQIDAAHRAARCELIARPSCDQSNRGALAGASSLHQPPRASSQAIKSRVTSSRLVSLKSSCLASA